MRTMLIWLCLGLAGCAKATSGAREALPVPVTVSCPVEREVTGLANEVGHPHQGTIDFVENQINPKTGTIRVRGVFPNKEQVLLPGLFARVRSPIGRSHKAVLVSERALDTDQGQKILYVVNENSEVVSRAVQPGALHDGLREITDGLKPGERVIVNGLQQVWPGVIVQPKLVEMPVALAAANAQKPEMR